MEVKNQTPEQFIKSLYNKTNRKDRAAFLCGFLMCLAVNMFVYTNTCFSHDSIKIFSDSDGLANGRILVGPLFELVNRMQLPWVIGLISCALMGFIIVYLARIYNLKSTLNILLAAGIVVTSDTVVSFHFYFSSLHIYLVSLLLAVMAVYYSDRIKYGYFLSVFLLCLSMLIYQAFLATAIGLFIFKLIELLFDDKNTLKKHFTSILKYASICIVSVLLYYVIWQLTLRLSGAQIVDYYAYEGIQSGEREGIITTLVNAFVISLYQFLGSPDNFFALSTVFVALTVLSLVFLVVKKKKRINQLLLIIYIFVYILSVNTMYIVSGSVSYSLTVFSLVLAPLTLLSLIDNMDSAKHIKSGVAIKWVAVVLSAVLVFGQSVYANSFYLKIKLNYDNAWSYATRLIDRLEQTEGFDENSEIVLVGEMFQITPYPSNADIKERFLYPSKSNYSCSSFVNNNAITYCETLEWFINQEMDMDINITSDPDWAYEDESIMNMNEFPKEGSIVQKDGKFIVKISDDGSNAESVD